MSSLIKMEKQYNASVPDLTTGERICLRSIINNGHIQFEVFLQEDIVKICGTVFDGFIVMDHDEHKVNLFANHCMTTPIQVPEMIGNELYYTMCIVNQLEEYSGQEKLIEHNVNFASYAKEHRSFSLIPARAKIMFSIPMIREITTWL